MLRAEFHRFPDLTRMRLEGRLVDLWARSVRAMASTCLPPPALLVDLTDVTYIDAIGEEVLQWLAKVGARFSADSCYSISICERLSLPLGKCNNHLPEADNLVTNFAPQLSRAKTGQGSRRRPVREVTLRD